MSLLAMAGLGAWPFGGRLMWLGVGRRVETAAVAGMSGW